MAWSGSVCFVGLLLLGSFLQLCSAEDLTCSITQSPELTVYNILHFSSSNVDISDCLLSWLDGTDDTVIAHLKGRKDDVVKSGNITTLITSQCFPRIIYQLNCVQRNIHHKVNCTIVCNPESVKSKDNSYKWIIGFVVVALFFIILLLCYIFRDKIRQRICSFYNRVSQNDDVALEDCCRTSREVKRVEQRTRMDGEGAIGPSAPTIED